MDTRRIAGILTGVSGVLITVAHLIEVLFFNSSPLDSVHDYRGYDVGTGWEAEPRCELREAAGIFAS